MSDRNDLIEISGTQNSSRRGDVIFVHGLGGDALSTWHPQERRDDHNFWPAWLGQDLSDVGIWSLAYEVEPFRWKGNSMPLVDRATNSLDLLDSYEIGDRPIIFITHSMGGLVVKQMLRSARDFGQWQAIASGTRGIVFLSTPHSGSDLASWINYIGTILRTTVSVDELKAHDPNLRNLNLWYRNHDQFSQIPMLVYCETRPTNGILVVNQTSADPGIKGVIPVPMDCDHISICKVEDKNNRIYRQVKRFVNQNLTTPLPPIQLKPAIHPDSNPESKQEDAKKKVDDGLGLKDIPQNLPHTHVSKFVGREPELETLHQGLQQRERVVISAISGMGGIGKTELALQYALNYWRKHYLGGVCWLQARDVDLGTQILEFAQLKMNLEVPQEKAGKPLTLEQKAQWCWDNWQPSDNLVLVILDDVTEYDKIKPYLPPNQPRFQIIITTRKQSLAESFEMLPLEVLSEAAALELLESLIETERLQPQLEEAKKLCKWLGYLPLGLELVGRYLKKKKDLSLAHMQQRLEKKHLEQRSLTEPAATMTAQRGVAAAFELSWLELDEQAQQLGCLLSLFALAPIPWYLVENCLPDQDSEDLEDLRDYSLLELNLLGRTDQGIYQLHELIREFLRDKMERYDGADQLKQGFGEAMVAVADKIPFGPTQKDIDAAIPAIPHLTEVAKVVSDWLKDEDLCKPFQGLGWFYQGQMAYDQALLWLEQGLELTRDRLGSEHPDVASSLNNLALLYDDQGRYCEAEPLFVQALEMRKKLYGQQHPDVAESLHNLAYLYNNQGRYCEAEPLFVQALEMDKKLYGQQHPDVATSLNNLALLYDNQGRYCEAEPLFVQALEMYKKLLGTEHPQVANSLNNLASLYNHQGRYCEAEHLYFEALEMFKKLYGQQHPSVANSLDNLAVLYDNQGRYCEAEPLFVQALEMRKKLYGQQHPSVAISLHNLANLYRDQGRYCKAEPLFVQALEMYKKLLGTEHPDVASSLHSLAGLYSNQGRYCEAELFFVQALEMRKKLLATKHPDVAQSLNNLAVLYSNQGRYCEAEPLFVQALEIYKKLLGTEHPDIASSLNNLASLYSNQGRYSEAEPLFVQALEIYKKLLGTEHPNLAQSLNNLAYIYYCQGQYCEAEPLFVQALGILEGKLGSNHPKTVTCRENFQKLRDELT